MLNKVNIKTQGGVSGGGFTGSQIRKSGRLSNGWTDCHQIWYTSADSSGNGLRLNTIRPSTLGGGGVRGSQIKNQGKFQTACPIGTTFVDSSGNGYTPNKLPRETQGGHLGDFRGSNNQRSGRAVKRLDRLAPTLVHICGFIWEWV